MKQTGETEIMRMLIVGSRPHTIQLLRQLFDMLGVRRTQATGRLQSALDFLCTQNYTAVFCDEILSDADADDFVRAARRAPGLINPMVPIFLVCAGPKRRDVEAARDLGFTDVITRPLSAATIQRKIKAATHHPRPFILAGDFFGPDRRTNPRGWFGGERRKRQPRKVKVAAPGDVEISDG